MEGHSSDRPLPAGYKLVAVRTTYLEMKSRPQQAPVAVPAGCAVERWKKPGMAEYRELFTAVGGPWGWSGRLLMEESELKAALHAGTTGIYRICCDGQTAGFAELNRSLSRQVEIAYFGLLPGFIGRGLGGFLLDWTIRKAWEGDTERVWLHTCQYDHAGALAVYLKAGFRVFDERVEMQPYAEEFLGRLRQAGS